MRHDLGVGLRGEAVAARSEPVAQLLVVFDDAVQDDRDASGAVVVRMGVLVRGPPVGGPARVAEPDDRPRVVAAGRRDQRVEVADGAHDVDTAAVEQGDAGRVVAAVLEMAQAVEDDGLAGASPGVANDAAHETSLPDGQGPVRADGETARSNRFVSAVAGGLCRSRSRPCRAGRHPPKTSMDLRLVTRSPLDVRGTGLALGGSWSAKTAGPRAQ